ncbi:short chain dehydrogenase [Longibacter salinarum]|uniref:Short chain dehydrogenase n=1 Tax=Longibacter salinarum TaxID=1850348 RepID=A0A2A8CTV4_9BACT|nr:short chain dehydrogenase [Longibacter salinarum]PEN11163.1 short chain dehydrogenase [Longibacter salinarum]
MTILVIGATGTIGSAICDSLESEHDVIRVARTSGDIRVDIESPESIRDMYEEAGSFDAVASAAGNAAFNPLDELSEDDFGLSIQSKLMGQVNLVRYGLPYLDNPRQGSFTLVSGILSQHPMPGSAAISMVNAGIEGFIRAAALDTPDGVRVNAVSPPWVSETLEEMGEDPSDGVPAAVVAKAYADSITGSASGEVLDPRDYA